MKGAGRRHGGRRFLLFLGPLLALGLSACSSPQTVLPDWAAQAEAKKARMVYTSAETGRVPEPGVAPDSASGSATSEAISEPDDDGREETVAELGTAAPLSRGVVYRAPEPLVWVRPYWATYWHHPVPAAHQRFGIPYGYSPYRHAFTSLYYPWYGWSPRNVGVYPHPWNAAYGPGFRSWAYVPPFGDADGSDFLFPNPGPGIPAYDRAASASFSRSGAAGYATRRTAVPRSSSRLEDFQAPQTLRPVNPGAVQRSPHASGVMSYPASGAGARRPGALAPATSRSGLSNPASSLGSRPRR